MSSQLVKRGLVNSNSCSGSEDEGQDLASDHWAGTRDDNGGDEGQMQPKSIGADLAELLEQAHLQASQAQYRFRGMQQELMTELPPGLPQDQVSQMLA